MHRLNRRILISTLVLLVAGGISLSGSALAEHGLSSGAVSSTSAATTVDDSTSTSTSSTDTQQETEIHNHANVLMQQFMQQGQADVQNESHGKAEMHTHMQRQQSCEARKTALTNRMNNAVTAAQRHKAVFDGLYTKIKTFYTTKNLNVANYADLTAKVDAAGIDASTKITALQSLNVTVDCSQADSLASKISAFRDAVGATRDSLKAYRAALVNLITAVHGASSANTSNSSTSNDTSAQ